MPRRGLALQLRMLQMDAGHILRTRVIPVTSGGGQGKVDCDQKHS